MIAGAALRIVPVRWHSWDAHVLEEDRPVCTIDVAGVRDRARFTLAGESYEIVSAGILPRRFRLERDGRVVASAERSGLWRRGFEVSAGDRSLAFRPTALLRRRFQLLHGDRVVGHFAPDGWLTRRARAMFPADIPLPIRIFIVFLGLTLWRRAARAAGS